MDKSELVIFNLDERLSVAQILIKNGYTVTQKKRTKGSSRSLEYYLEICKTEDSVASK